MLAENESSQQTTHRVDCGDMALDFGLRALVGWDEYALGEQPGVAHRLLRRVATDLGGQSLALDTLAVSLVDRVLAELYISCYGDEAECQVRCSACGDRYEFTLSLREMMSRQDELHPGPAEGDGSWHLDDGRRVRAPLFEDSTVATGEADLGSAVMVDGRYDDDPDGVDNFLERAAPILAVDLTAACASCSSPQSVHFDLADYLGARLLDDRKYLLREIHLLASTYRWSQAEILDLAQVDRRSLVKLIESERSAVRKVRL